MSPTERALSAFLQHTDGDCSWQRADRALTLQMLCSLAPRFSAQHALRNRLSESLHQLHRVPASFEPTVDIDEAMSRLDALYLLQLHGLSLPEWSSSELQSYIEQASVRPGGRLPAWLMGEQALLLGVKAQIIFSERYPFLEHEWALHLYHLTHLILVETSYFHRRAEPERYGEELRHFSQAVGLTVQHGMWDILAEIVFCQAACGQRSSKAVTTLKAVQRGDGTWAETGAQERSLAHTTAACLIALVAAEECVGEDPLLRL